MADRPRDRLARGTKLTRDHVYTPISQIGQTDLNAGIIQSFIKDGWATFRMAWHIHSLHGPYWNRAVATEANDYYAGTMGIPFVLPPFQEFFSQTGEDDVADTPIILEGFGLSFDQRGEAGVIASVASADEGKISKEQADVLVSLGGKLELKLLEKNSRVWDAAAPRLAEKVVFDAEFPLVAAFSDDEKLVPYNKDGLEIPMHPYKTYVLAVDASDLNRSEVRTVTPTTTDPCLPSTMLWLKFRTPLVPRDIYNGTTKYTQNIPTRHNGVATGETVTITQPAVDTQIEADTASGVQTNLGHVDKRYVEQLRGGYDDLSDVHPTEHLATDSAYDVIVVPMWASTVPWIEKGMGGDLPWVGGSPYQGWTGDRRVIRLRHPVVIHHVVAVLNWAGQFRATGAGPGDAFRRPNSVNFETEIGVGIGVGFRADDHAYQQVAHAAFNATEASKSPLRIDQVQLSHLYGHRHESDWIAQELLQIPLVHAGHANKGTSYLTAGGVDTGVPVFAGPGATPTEARSNISSGVTAGAYGASAVAGQDQYLEVRWNFRNNVDGLEGGAVHADRIYVGYPSHWVYIFCKKALC